MLRTIMSVLASEYVRVHEVIQVAYTAMESDAGVVGGFVSDRPNRPDVVFLGGPPVGKALEIHGARWKELQPESHLLAGRATALVVNAANKIDSLSLEQLESIWSGEADDWSVIDGTGLTPPDWPLPGTKGPTAIPVHRYGLRKNERATEVFERARPARAKNGRMAFLPSTEEVVASVGVDPYAIGFVDLAAIPKTGQTIKVIGIIGTKNNAGGDGQKPEVIYPSAATIRDGTYPFAERVFLFVHPKASEAAKGFAEFLASESLEQAYHSHGLLPLVNSKKDQVVSPPPSAKPVPTEGWSFP